MRGCPPCELTIGRSRIWRTAICLIVTLTGAVLVAWLVAAPQGGSPAVRAGIAGAVLAVVMMAASLFRPIQGRLRFTGAHWTLAPHQHKVGPGETIAGRLDVHLDLGSFMLLRFVPHLRGPGCPRARWIPVSKSSAMGDWHGLRCAAYAQPPVADSIGVATGNPS